MGRALGLALGILLTAALVLVLAGLGFEPAEKIVSAVERAVHGLGGALGGAGHTGRLNVSLREIYLRVYGNVSCTVERNASLVTATCETGDVEATFTVDLSNGGNDSFTLPARVYMRVVDNLTGGVEKGYLVVEPKHPGSDILYSYRIYKVYFGGRGNITYAWRSRLEYRPLDLSEIRFSPPIDFIDEGHGRLVFNIAVYTYNETTGVLRPAPRSITEKLVWALETFYAKPFSLITGLPYRVNTVDCALTGSPKPGYLYVGSLLRCPSHEGAWTVKVVYVHPTEKDKRKYIVEKDMYGFFYTGDPTIYIFVGKKYVSYWSMFLHEYGHALGLKDYYELFAKRYKSVAEKDDGSPILFKVFGRDIVMAGEATSIMGFTYPPHTGLSILDAMRVLGISFYTKNRTVKEVYYGGLGRLGFGLGKGWLLPRRDDGLLAEPLNIVFVARPLVTYRPGAPIGVSPGAIIDYRNEYVAKTYQHPVPDYRWLNATLALLEMYSPLIDQDSKPRKILLSFCATLEVYVDAKNGKPPYTIHDYTPGTIVVTKLKRKKTDPGITLAYSPAICADAGLRDYVSVHVYR